MNSIFPSLQDAIHQLFGSDRSVARKQPVSGGDINDACALTLDDGTPLFLKSNSPESLSGFQAEWDGLHAIAETGTIGTAKPLALGTDPDGISFLLMEHIESGPKVSHYWETFAAELAAMHAAPARDGRYGFPADNFIGSNSQINTWTSSWVDFFRTYRLEVQFRQADRYFETGERKAFLRLLDHLDRYLPEPERPSLLHGDLWAGNYLTGPDGKAWIIDPAVYYGHPEADLAMTELFGGFDARFYDAYRDCGNLEPEYPERRDLYNLYHLLNHLNLFGGGYLSSVRPILRRYGG